MLQLLLSWWSHLPAEVFYWRILVLVFGILNKCFNTRTFKSLSPESEQK